MSASAKKSRNFNRDRILVVTTEPSHFINDETNDEFHFPCPFFLSNLRGDHIGAMNAINAFIFKHYVSHNDGTLRQKEAFLRSKGLQGVDKDVFRCICSSCNYSVQLYFYKSSDESQTPTGWYLTDLHETRHSECNCPIVFSPRTHEKRPVEMDAESFSAPEKRLKPVDEVDLALDFLLTRTVHTAQHAVAFDALPDWCLLELYDAIRSRSDPDYHASPYCTDRALAERELHLLSSNDFLQLLVTVLADSVDRYKRYLLSALNFEAVVLGARWQHFQHAAQFQDNVFGTLKLIGDNSKTIDAPKAQKVHRRVLECFQVLRGERHPDCAHAYFDLALSCERTGSFEWKTVYLVQALRIFLHYYDRQNDRNDQMLEPLYYLACLRFRTWCTADFERQRDMLELCYRCGQLVLEKYSETATRWIELHAKIVQSLGITYGELRDFHRKQGLLEEAVRLRQSLYRDSDHIEVVRTMLHVVINRQELDGDVERKRAGLWRIYEQMRQHFGTEQHTEMAWTLRNIAEATADRLERRALLERVLHTQIALLVDKSAHNVSIARTKVLIEATYAEASTSSNAPPSPAPAMPAVKPRAEDDVVITQLRDLTQRLCCRVTERSSPGINTGEAQWLTETDGLFEDIVRRCT